MPEVIMKLLADEPLAKEPKESSNFVDLNNGTGPLQILRGDKVKTGATDAVTETVGDREITWVFVEALEVDDNGNKVDNADKKKGFVSSKFLVSEGTAVSMSGGMQPFSAAVDKAVFVEACYVQAALNKTNPAYLYALAFALTGDKWPPTQVQTSDPAGVFRIPQGTWDALLSEPEAAGFLSSQNNFPTAQCVVAAIIAAKSANLLQGLIANRGLSAVDLFLAHLFADQHSFGSNAAARILQAEITNKGQRSEDVIKAEIYPDPDPAGLRAAFLQRNAEIFGANGSATIEQALKACVDKLAAGFADVAAVTQKMGAGQATSLLDCQVEAIDGNIPDNPRAPLTGGVSAATGAGAGGGVIEAQQHATRNEPITTALHDILEYAGRKTGIDVEIYSGGQPPTGSHRVGTHRHDVGGERMGAADLHMRDARTGRILDSDNADDLKRIAEFITESAAAGATGIGHARGYMGPRSTHIGGGEPVIAWGAGNSAAGAPDWVKVAFARGRAHPLTSLASALSALRQAPIQSATTNPDDVKSLAAARQQFSNELHDPEIHRLVGASTNAEVGGQGLKAEQYYIESVFNRATARNMTLKLTLTSDRRNGGYYPATTIDKLGDPVPPAKQAEIDQVIARVMAGANESNFATGNESGSVHSGDAPVTRDLGPGRERFVREIPDNKWIKRAIAAAAAGGTSIA
jgi:hypothetical protein